MKQIYRYGLSGVCLFLLFINTAAQKSSIIVLGDLHYDLMEDHDMAWLRAKGDDYRQVTEEYTVFTERYWDDFMHVIRNKSLTLKPEVKAIVQVGDLSEGLAGTPEKARQMASNTMIAIGAQNGIRRMVTIDSIQASRSIPPG